MTFPRISPTAVHAVLLLLASLLVPSVLFAAGTWDVSAEGSALRFVGRQQSAPFTGRFESFEAEVDLDPAAPADGRIAAVVDVRSARTGNRDRDEYLQARDFFYSRRYPESTFETVAIRPVTGTAGAYVADASLTLRGETRNVEFRFTLVPEGDVTRLQGEVLLNRLDFGVGQGEWRDTSEIAAEVRVEVDLALLPPSSSSGVSP